MPYKLKYAEGDVLGKEKFKNDDGKTECVEFVRQATGAPKTQKWKRGLKVADARQGEIVRGTAIATFDDRGKYPTDRDQGEVKPRLIWFKRPTGTRRSNDANTFYVIE